MQLLDQVQIVVKLDNNTPYHAENVPSNEKTKGPGGTPTVRVRVNDTALSTVRVLSGALVREC